MLALEATPGAAPNNWLGSQVFEPRQSSPNEASDEYKEMAADVKKAIKDGLSQSTCTIDRHEISCLEEHNGRRRILLPPYTAHLPVLRDTTSYERIETGWAPISEILSGEEVLQSWRSYANSGQPFTCENQECEIVVNAPDKGLARCFILKTVTGELGTPSNCRFIAKQEDGTFFLRVIRDSGLVSADSGRRDFDIVVHGALAQKRSRLEPLLIKALQDNPLSLSVSHEQNGDIVGIASYRSSKVLVGWREIVTIRISFGFNDRDHGEIYSSHINRKRLPKSPPTITIQAISTLYVNRQNTDNHSDWILPSKTQESQWQSALSGNIKTRLHGLCPKLRWLDDWNLDCG